MFCSKVSRTDAFGDIGVEDINLRHPRTHATGWTSWQIRFPVDADLINPKRQERDASMFSVFSTNNVFSNNVVTRSALLRDLSFA